MYVYICIYITVDINDNHVTEHLEDWKKSFQLSPP